VQVVLRLLGITLLVAGLAQALGASAVGAFLVGIAVPSAFADRARAILRPLRDVFASIFFVAFGLATDPTSALPVLRVVLVFALVTTASKIASGSCRAGQLSSGAALVARGELPSSSPASPSARGWPRSAWSRPATSWSWR
jgi:CPA2 family monovalent cation:H+ antiporter-2